MKTYSGHRDSDSGAVMVMVEVYHIINGRKAVEKNYPLTHIVRHSPRGFGWGGGGSGSADLALSILGDFYGQLGKIEDHYIDFQNKVLWGLRNSWEITNGQILAFGRKHHIPAPLTMVPVD